MDLSNLDSIEQFARTPSNDSMSRLIACAKHQEFQPEEIYHLAHLMAQSGHTIEHNGDTVSADLASTGGPTSLSTLLGPLYLRSYGFIVPKLGVPGRPAGGVDILAQVPGYRISFTPSEIGDILARCGYVHFIADDTFAPLDALLFRFRQNVGAQSISALAVASLLAKKIACRIDFAGLDVRVASHGNFGSTFSSARQSARTFCAAAQLAHIGAVAILTDARCPYQPFIGRGEALLALDTIFEGRADRWLKEHDDQCRLMAAHVASIAIGSKSHAQLHDIRTLFFENINAQGGSEDAFKSKVEIVAKSHRHELIAEVDGFIGLDLATMRSAFVDIHSSSELPLQFPDEVGMILHVSPGAYVKKGDMLATVRATDPLWPEIGPRLRAAFQIGELMEYAPGVEEIVRA
jgi:thymidine phosphorylase